MLMNNYDKIIHRALTTSHIPSRLEPAGLDCSDGKRPDGITMVPWKNGNLLIWDATCSDTYAPSHLALSTNAAGAIASQAEDRKMVKYSYLEGHPGICFTPIAYETSGVVGSLSLIFLKELAHRLSATTGDTKSYSYLLQRLSVAVQRGNAIIGTLFSPSSSDIWGGGGGGGGGNCVFIIIYGYAVFLILLYIIKKKTMIKWW